MFPLILTKGIARLLAKLAVNISGVVALVLERFLNVHNHLVRWKIGIGIDWTIASVADKGRIVPPRREPISAVPVPRTPSAADDDHIVMRAPPIMIMPNVVVIGENGVAVSPMSSVPVTAIKVGKAIIRSMEAIAPLKGVVLMITSKTLLPFCIEAATGQPIVRIQAMFTGTGI